jgi:hypothetical protein
LIRKRASKRASLHRLGTGPLSIAFFALGLVSPTLSRAETTVVSIGASDEEESLRAKIPVSGAFTLEYTFQSEVDEATFTVWPDGLRSCETGPPARGTKQTYRLPLKIETEEGVTKGTTTVPHLQVAQTFCFQLEATRKVPPDQARLDAAIRASGRVVATPDEARSLANALLKATAKDLCRLKSEPADSRPECMAIDLTPIEYPLLEAVLQAHTDKVQRDELEKQLGIADGLLQAHKEEVKTFTPPDALKLQVPSAEWLALPPPPSPVQRIPAALTAVAANARDLKGRADAMVAWLNGLKEKQARFDQLEAEARKARRDAAASESAGLARQRDVAYAFFKDKLRARERGSALKVRGKTSDFNNYLSPELGMAVAYPLLKGSDVSLVPYTAVNIYFTPVDRELSLSEVVDPFLQRVSLTVGLTLSQDLKARNTTFSPTVADTFGILGAGVRILPFARAAGMLMFAKASPSGGLSSQSKLVTAAALSLSADVDVVTFIGNSLSSK